MELNLPKIFPIQYEPTKPKTGRVSDDLYKMLIVSESYEEFCMVLETYGYEFPPPTKKVYRRCLKSPFSFFTLCLYPGKYPLAEVEDIEIEHIPFETGNVPDDSECGHEN